MIALRAKGQRGDMRIKGSTIEQLSFFKYLQAKILNGNWETKRERRSRIEVASRAFNRMKKFFVRGELSLNLKLRMVRCYKFSILLNGRECWMLNPKTEKDIEAFEIHLSACAVYLLCGQNYKSSD